jgi:hypothetical protein
MRKKKRIKEENRRWEEERKGKATITRRCLEKKWKRERKKKESRRKYGNKVFKREDGEHEKREEKYI